MRIQDHTSPPCTCGECQQAGVSDRPQIRDPQTGALLHGYRLRRFHEAADEAMARIQDLLGKTAGPKVGRLLLGRWRR